MTQDQIIEAAGSIRSREDVLRLVELVIEECAKIATSSVKDCCEGNSEWHRGFRYAAQNTALQAADRIRKLAVPRG